MKTFRSLIPAIALVFCFNFLSAQEMTAKKYENAQWYTVDYVQFEPGKANDAKKIIDEYFIPTDKDSNLPGPVMELEVVFGDWDMIVLWKMEDGVEALTWEVHPDLVKWLTAFEKRAGSKEKAVEIQKEFSSYIKTSKSELVRKRT